MLDSTLAEAHYNYANLLFEEETVRDVQAAKAHYETALKLTSPSGELLDSTNLEVHNNYAMLLAEMDHWSDSLRHFARYLRLSGSRPGIHVSTAREALLDTLGEPEAMSESVPAVPAYYRLSLACTVESDRFFALLTAEETWDHHFDLSQDEDVYPTAFAGGVWYAVLCSLAGRDDVGEVAETVQETVEPHLDRLSPPVQALYTLWFTDQSAATPSELRKRLDTEDYITALEIDAYERLLNTFGS